MRFKATLLSAMTIFLLLFANAAFPQTYEIDAYNGQVVTTCGGSFYDSGGSGGNYANNESFSMTFCSASGQYLTFDFSLSSSSLNLDAGTGDTLYFYNGTTATGTPIAFLTSSDDVAFTQLMINTLSTCVTVVWHSDGSAVDGGWNAVIACENPPVCAGNPPASDIFGQATTICNLNNYCGTTASYYGEDLPYNLGGGGTCPAPDDGIFGGTIENNSWLAFQAISTTASFDFTVTNCSGDGIQVGIFGFNGSVFNLVSPCALTDGSQGGTFTVTASALTIGSTYYIMIDGNAGATCDYIIHANTGVAVVSAGPDQNICVSNTTMAALAPNAGTGTWSTIAGNGTFSNINSPTSSVSGLSNGTNTFVWTIPSGPCENVSDTVNINVSAGSSPIISYATPFCATTSTPQAVTLTGTSGGTYSASPAGLSINSTTGAITPSGSTAGNYTVTYTVAGACGPSTTTVVINAVGTPAFSIPTTLCSGSTAPLLPGTSSNGISGTWSPSTVSNTTTGTYIFTPTAGQCGIAINVTVTVMPGSNPTFTSSTVNVSCAGPTSGSITIVPTSTGQTYHWVSGPVVSPVAAANLPAGATNERTLVNLPVGTYCVDITGGSSTTTTQTLFTETFETGLTNWTLDNSNGNNIWIRNNSYTGGTCMVGATPFSCPNVPNQPAAITGYPLSYYLHVNATTTSPVVCGSGSSTPFPPLNANFNGSDGTADQKATINATINTTGLTNIVFSFYWMGDGDANDYGALEYSLNGGTSWTIAGAKLNNQTTWIAGSRTDASWANQSNLRFRFRWINNSSSSQDPPICIDQITITGDQASTCSSTVQQCFTITAPSSVTPTFSTIPAVCQGATAPVFPVTSTNTPPISGTWNPAVSTTSAGTTSYTFTPAAGQCATTTTLSITVNPKPVITPAASPASICPGQSSSLSAAGASTYAWMPGNLSGTPVTVSPLSTSVYTVTGTSAAGCTGSANITVSMNPSASITATASPNTICQGQSSSLTAGGASTYSWIPGNLTGSPVSVNPATSAVYTVTGTTATGCTGTATVSVTVNPNPTLSASALPATICAGQSSALSAAGANTYSWMPGSLTGSPVNVTPSSTTSYTVTGVSSLGCSGTASITVTVNPNPTVGATATPAAVCFGQSTNLSASGAASYTWSPAGQTGTPVSVTPSATSVYTVTGTSAAGCTGSATLTVAVNPLPSVSATANPGAVCAGSTSVLTGNGANTYSWTPGSITGSPVSVSPATTTTYTVTGTSAAGCSGSNTVTVNVNPLPVITASASPPAFCIGSGTSLTAGGATTYAWSHGAGNSNPAVISPLVSTTYTVTGTMAGCSNTASVSVTVFQIPVINVNASPGNICIGSSSVLTAFGADTFIWSPAASLSATSGNSVSAHPTTNTVYTVTGDRNGCSGSESVSVDVHSSITVNVNPVSDTICNGNNTLLTAGGAVYYHWTPSASLSSSTGTTVTANPTATTTYIVTGTDATGCTGSASAVIALFNNANIPFVTLPKEGCAPLGVGFEYIPDGQIDMSTLHWDFGDPMNSGDVSGLTNPTYSYNESGLYIVSLSGMSVFGCAVADYDTIIAWQAPEADFMFHPTISETNNPLVDFYDQSYFASTWSWNFGDPGAGTNNSSILQYPSHTFTDTGTFTIQLVVTNENQCSDTAVKNLKVRESYEFFMPNAFSPNGDGVNETFIGQGVGIVENEFDMYIYDRWGEKLFHSDNLFVGWDGRDASNGEPIEQGLYVWIVMLTDRTGIEHQLTGTVMMIR